DHTAQPSMLGRAEFGVLGDELLGFLSGFLQRIRVAMKIGDSERREAMLLGAEYIAGTSHSEIGFCQFEPIRRGTKRLEAKSCLFMLDVGEHTDVARILTSS